MSHPPLARYALALALLAPLSAAYAAASGSVHFRDAEWTVADGVVIVDDDGLEIVLMSKPFDRAKAMEDGELDTFDVMRGDANSITINLEADGPTMCVDFMSRSGDTQMSGSSCNSDFPPAIRIDKRTDTQVAGSMAWGEDGADHIKVQFDLPVGAAAK